ncbi:MAG TPA: alpha/beta hydrolase [Ktedonobacteraceae bacterium]|nr:alpha/beta hydrolase [Ktedonobacteraceae bacterium]
MAHSEWEGGLIGGINDAPIYYEVLGEGKVLVLLHAGVADCRMWDEQFETFAEHYRVIRYDLRGFGRSSVPSSHFAQHDELAEILAFLSVSHASILGVSYGGKVALDFTLAHPEMVEKLILVAPSVSGSEPSPDVLAFYEAEEKALAAEDLQGATELNLKMWVDGPKRSPEEVNPSVRERIGEMQYHAFQTVFPEEAVEPDLEPPAALRLAEVKVPTLLIVGDYDIQAKIDQAHRLASEIAGAQLAVIAQAAHIVNMEKPAEFNALVLDFLAQ